MTNHEFVAKLELAAALTTLYVKGGFGAVAGYDSNRERYINAYTYNKKRADMINAAPNDSFFFDCVCLGKGILWGWNANTSKRYGGAIYESKDVPDFTVTSVPKHCSSFSEKMTDDIAVGEWLIERDASGTIDHVGYYIGNGEVIEATPRWSNGVQFTTLAMREWCGHGKIKYLDYVDVKPTRYAIVLNTYDTRKAAEEALEEIRGFGKVVEI